MSLPLGVSKLVYAWLEGVELFSGHFTVRVLNILYLLILYKSSSHYIQGLDSKLFLTDTVSVKNSFDIVAEIPINYRL